MAGLVNADGTPLLRPLPSVPTAPTTVAAPAKRRAALSGENAWAFPYDAASWYQPESDGWLPVAYSPDHEINIYRDRMVGRVRDLVRNDGWASGAILNTLDQVIGGAYRLIALPDWRWLQRRYGPLFDAVWAEEYRAAVESEWRDYTEDPLYYGDAERQLNLADQMYLALRHQLVDGETIGASEWHPERVGYGRARYATTLRLIDPDRLSNPNEMVDTRHRRGGVEIDDDGVPLGYWLRRGHAFDWYQSVDSMIWDFLPRETEWGRPLVLHYYERDRATQHRGLAAFTPVLNDFKMGNRFSSVTLQAAILSAVFSLAVESPYDPEGLKELLQSGQLDDLNNYSALRATYHKDRPIRLNNAAVLPLFPGEQIKTVQPTQPGHEFDPFMHHVLRKAAAATGSSTAEITRDWSRNNYSSLRGELVAVWRTVSRRRAHFDRGFAKPFYVAWLEEAHDVAGLPLPAAAPDFIEARGALSRCKWIGAPRGWVDPVKEAQGAVLRMDAGLSSLQQEGAEQGHDWEEMLDQRARERQRMQELGIPFPEWIAGISALPGTDGEPANSPPAYRQERRPRPM
jgi:lambda family phage portal protein